MLSGLDLRQQRQTDDHETRNLERELYETVRAGAGQRQDSAKPGLLRVLTDKQQQQGNGERDRAGNPQLHGELEGVVMGVVPAVPVIKRREGRKDKLKTA